MTNPAMQPRPTAEMPPPFKKGLPTREKCDLTSPFEMFLWCFVGLPGLNGAPMLLPIDYYQLVSKRLYDLGARLAEEPTLRYQSPSTGDPNWASSPGKWVPADTPRPEDPRPPVAQLVDQLPPQQQAALFRELYDRHTDDQRQRMMRGENPPGTSRPDGEKGDATT